MSVLDLVRHAYATWERSKPLPKAVVQAVQRMLVCRTAALGGHKQVCPSGHFQRSWYNSCKHRFCPQ